MKVKDLINNDMIINNHYVSGISDNSKDVMKNYIFFAILGYTHNGFDFIDEAIKKGAKTIISDDIRIISVKNNYKNKKINFLYYESIKNILASILKKFNEDFRKKVKIISVSGTNAKTSITTLVYKYLRYLNINAIYIGTNGVYVNDLVYKTNNTTLGLVNLYKCIRYAALNDISYIITEVSSQGIKEGRVKYINFDIGLLTNITIDHLDYHKTFDDYFYTKINYLYSCRKVIINGSCEKFIDISNIYNKDDYLTYGIKEKEDVYFDYYANSLNLSLEESNFYLNISKDYFKYYINTSLLGSFNVSNILGFIAIIDNLDEGIYFNSNIFSFLSSNIQIDGRFEITKTNKGIFIIDFAHTPDGVFNVLSFLKRVCKGKLICCMGLGGNRDVSKRQIVGEIVSRYADLFILTSDNPRDEEQDHIVCDVLKGINLDYVNDVFIINDRYEAIKKAYLIANEQDCIAILGKGNETNQIIKGISYPFNDLKVLKEIIKDFDGVIYE